MSYGQMTGFQPPNTTVPLPATQLTSSPGTVSTGGRNCCENGRPIITDPHTGQTICSCQYSAALLPYARVAGLAEGVGIYNPAAAAAAAAAYSAQGLIPPSVGADGSAFYSPMHINIEVAPFPNDVAPTPRLCWDGSIPELPDYQFPEDYACLTIKGVMVKKIKDFNKPVSICRPRGEYFLKFTTRITGSVTEPVIRVGSPPYELGKEPPDGWRVLPQAGGCFPYEHSLAMYPYGAGYGGLDLNGARRKNATRETTNTLKAWLYEHRKNPYPTKGEKIMLAIITKMTLTQVSTWFANARRRLKKENKMTWTPRNRTDDEADDNSDIDVDDKDGDDKENDRSHDLDDDDILSMKGDDEDDDNGDEKDVDVGTDADEDAQDRKLDMLGHRDDNSLHADQSSTTTGRGSSCGLGDRLDSPVSKRPSSVHSDSLEGPSVSMDLRTHCLEHSPGKSARLHPSGYRPPTECQIPSESRVRNPSVPSQTPPTTTTQTRPKIWSVSEFLNDSSSKDSNRKSTSPDTFENKSVKSANSHLEIHNPAQIISHAPRLPMSMFSYIPSSSHHPTWINGRFHPANASPAFPIAVTHATLSYPYGLSAHALMNSRVHPAHVAQLHHQRPEDLSRMKAEVIRSQALFSPARDLDSIRTRPIPERESVAT